MTNISRNAVCFCGSGQKYKHCHGNLNIENEDSRGASLLKANGLYASNLMSPEVKTVCKDQPSGTVVMRSSVPPGIFIIQPFLNELECEKTIQDINSEEKMDATIQDKKDLGKRINQKLELIRLLY